MALWDWEYDDNFIARLGRACAARSVRFLEFHESRIEEFTDLLETGAFCNSMVFDRVSDVMPGLLLYLLRLRENGSWVINDPEGMNWCKDKATMHLELLSAGVRVPYGVVISTEDHPEQMAIMEMSPERLGTPFVIKPAVGGGGDGVVLNACSPQDVYEYFRRLGRCKVVLQRRILPQRLGTKRGWFRVFWVLGEIHPCWWDDHTHVYEPLSMEDERLYNLEELRAITALIAQVSGMDLFTTELAMDDDSMLVAVDFVNEMPDLRPQSVHRDGVPDALLERIAERLADHAAGANMPGKGLRT